MGALNWKRWALLAALLGMVVLGWASGVGDYLSLEAFQQHERLWRGWVEDRLALAAAIYVAIFVMVVMSGIPGGVVMSIIGGTLFGVWLAVPLIALGVTVGAVLIFLLARGSLRGWMEELAGERVRAILLRLRRHAFVGLIVLRMTSLFPFLLVDIAAAVVGMELGEYVLATVLGVLPGSVALALAGNGVGDVLKQGVRLTPEALLVPKVLWGMGVFTVLSAGAVVWAWRRGRK